MLVYRGARYRTSSKTYRDTERATGQTLYHVSPERLTHFSPRSRFHTWSGLFFSPSYRSLVQDWAHWVMHKKYALHPLVLEAQRLRKEIETLEAKADKTEEDEARIKSLEAKWNKVRKSHSQYVDNAVPSNYRTVYVHKVHCPGDVYAEAKRLFDEAYDAGYKKGCFGFWCWGAQIFVPAASLPRLRLLSVQELSLGDLHDEYDSISLRKPRWFEKPKA